MQTIRKRLFKTVTYRITASVIAQFTSWIFFQKIEVNVAVLVADLIQMGYYYMFESLWRQNHKI